MFEAKVRERAGDQVMIASKMWCLKGRKEFHGNSSTATGDDYGQGERQVGELSKERQQTL